LFEADFNFVLKLIWGKRLASTLNPTAFGSENHGSRLRVDAYFSHSVQLPMMPSRATTASSKVFDLNARIVVRLPFGRGHSTKHRLFRAYFGTDDDELEDLGQGGGASQAVWLIYSVSMLATFSYLI
jgi:hypothetical protein